MKSQDIIDYLKGKGIPFSVPVFHNDEITGYSSLFKYRQGTVTFVSPQNHFSEYEASFAPESIGFIVLCEDEGESDRYRTAIKVKNSREVFFDVVENLLWSQPDEETTGISSNPEIYRKRSFVSEKAVIGKNVKIGVGCVIEGNVTIGDNTEIHHNVVIRERTKIGKNCMIYSCTVIGESYGFVTLENKERKMLQQYGGVTIEDDVVIGDHCSVLRGAIEDTTIGKGTKLTALVSVAHNVSIGERTLIVTPCQLCGSASVGNDCHIAGTVIRNQRTVGDGATVGLGAVVVKNVEPGTTVVGNPAHVLEKR